MLVFVSSLVLRKDSEGDFQVEQISGLPACLQKSLKCRVERWAGSVFLVLCSRSFLYSSVSVYPFLFPLVLWFFVLLLHCFTVPCHMSWFFVRCLSPLSLSLLPWFFYPYVSLCIRFVSSGFRFPFSCFFFFLEFPFIPVAEATVTGDCLGGLQSLNDRLV